jgi:hypothetical protein
MTQLQRRVVGTSDSPIGPDQFTSSETLEYTVVYEDGQGPAMTAPTTSKRDARQALRTTRSRVDARAQLATSTVRIERSSWVVLR